MDQVSKNGITYNEVKTIFNDEIIKFAHIIALEKPSNNRTKLLRTKVFLYLGEVFTGRFYSIEIFDDKYEVVELKIKQMINTRWAFRARQRERTKISAERTKLRKQKSDEQPDTTVMPDLESEESAAQRRNQQGQGLKILTPSHMISRLPISLALSNAGNNSEKLKNEIRQLLYSLYRSKKLTKNIYKSLVDII